MTDDVRRLLAWFDSGALVRPGGEEPGFIDLVRALATVAGAGGLDLSSHARSIIERVGDAEHVVFVLIDGLSDSFLAQTPADGFLRTHTVGRLKAVFPSTTSAALTTLATARWPGEHAVPSWWLYLPGCDLHVTSLPYIERFTERPLTESDILPQELFPVPSVWGGATRSLLTLLPPKLVDAVYTRYSSAGNPCRGYEPLEEVVDVLARRVAEADGPTFTYVYVPHLDAMCHGKGRADGGVAPLLAMLDGWLAQLREALGPRGRLVTSADHGMIDIPSERRIILEPGDPLLDALVTPPTGEPRTPILFARPGRAGDVRRLMAERCDDAFALLAPQECEELGLFGPGPLSDASRRRLGTLVGIAAEPTALYTRVEGKALKMHVGFHAGLSPEEMWVPLAVA